jgi:regulatory protein
MEEPVDRFLKKCRDAAYRLLSRRDHSEAELREKLGRRFEPEPVERILAELRRRGLIEDRRFALRFARELLTRGPCGERFIRRKLRRRGIEPAIIDETLSELAIDEVELVRTAVRLKLPSLDGLAPETAARRLFSHLERRGFPGRLAREAALRLLRDPPPENEP